MTYARWRPKSVLIRLFIQQLFRAYNRDLIFAQRDLAFMSPGFTNFSSFPQIIAIFCSRIGRAVFNLKRLLLSGVPDFFGRNKILSGGDLSHYQVPHCFRVFFSFVWFVFIYHNFQFYFELCTYCNILDIYHIIGVLWVNWCQFAVALANKVKIGLAF